jgi:hypothetical protein
VRRFPNLWRECGDILLFYKWDSPIHGWHLLWQTLFSFWHFNVWYTCSYASPSGDKTLIFVIFSSVLTNRIITRGAAHGWSKNLLLSWVMISFACISCKICFSSLHGFNGQFLLTSRWERFAVGQPHVMHTICMHEVEALFLVLYLLSTILQI